MTGKRKTGKKKQQEPIDKLCDQRRDSAIAIRTTEIEREEDLKDHQRRECAKQLRKIVRKHVKGKLTEDKIARMVIDLVDQYPTDRE